MHYPRRTLGSRIEDFVVRLHFRPILQHARMLGSRVL